MSNQFIEKEIEESLKKLCEKGNLIIIVDAINLNTDLIGVEATLIYNLEFKNHKPLREGILLAVQKALENHLTVNLQEMAKAMKVTLEYKKKN